MAWSAKVNVWVLGSAAMTNGLGLVTLLLLRSNLTTEQFDRFTFAFTVANLIAMVGTLGFGQFLPRHGAGLSSGEAAGVASVSASMVAISSLVLSVGLVLGAYILSERSGHVAQLYLWFGVFIICGNLTTLAQGYYRSRLNLWAFRAPHLLRAAISVGCLLLVWVSGPGLDAVAGGIALAVGAAIAAAVSFVPIIKVKGRERMGLANSIDWLKISIPMVSTTAMRTLNKRTDILLFAYYGQSGLGDYLLQARFAELLSYVTIVASAKLVPRLAAARRNGRLKSEGQMAARRSALLSVIFLGPISASSALICYLALGSAASLEVFAVLASAQVLRIVFGPVGEVAGAVNLQNVAFRTAASGLLINVGVGVMLIPVLGQMGAALGTLCSTLFWSLWLARRIHEATGIRIGLSALSTSAGPLAGVD